MTDSFSAAQNRQLIQGNRLQKEFRRQDEQSQGLSALTRALMTVPENRLTKNHQSSSSISTTTTSIKERPKRRYVADYSEKTLAIVDRAKRDAEKIQQKLERTLIAQERRAKVQLMQIQKQNLREFINAQRPVLDLEDEQARRLKIYGDPAKEVAEMRQREQEEKREARRRKIEEDEEEEEE